MSEFEIPQDNYLVFDAYTMKQYIRDRLNESEVFTDQNFEGSYLTTINNIVAYTFNSLMYYLNNTSSESMFSEAQIYENMNRIVKMLSYKPVGFQTATLPFTPTVGAIDTGIYLIPRYSYFIANNIAYSFNEDIFFEKTTSASEVITDLANQKLLFQGRFREYATQTATGENNETVLLSTPIEINVDHFNIFVFVNRASSNTWEEWTQTENLYLEGPTNTKFEARLNENQNYEIRFGDNINGAKLQANDTVAIYYLESDGVNGEVGETFLNNTDAVFFTSTQYSEIMNDVRLSSATQLPNSTLLTVTNTFPSSQAKNIESVESIRENAPGAFRSQLRLVTSNDYLNFARANFSNFIHDVSINNNWQYLSGRIQYLYDLGVSNPLDDASVLYSHAIFSDACNFNNVYITACPKTSPSTANVSPILSNSQKQTIISTMNARKTLTTEIIILDPIYIAVDLGRTIGGSVEIDDIAKSSLVVEKRPGSRRSDQDIKQDIADVFTTEFSQANRLLGDIIDVNKINNDILSIDGVGKVYTKHSDNNSLSTGVSLIMFNPIYPQDVNLVSDNTELQSFQFAFFDGADTIIDRIEIDDQNRKFEGIEY